MSDWPTPRFVLAHKRCWGHGYWAIEDAVYLFREVGQVIEGPHGKLVAGLQAEAVRAAMEAEWLVEDAEARRVWEAVA